MMDDGAVAHSVSVMSALYALVIGLRLCQADFWKHV